MLFSSTFFLFIFLPILLILYYGVGRKIKGRNYLLLAASLLFYAWGEPTFVVIMIGCIIANYAFGCLVDKHRSEGVKVRWILTSMVCFNLIILGIFKYAGFVVQNINGLLNLSLPVPQITLPIGISFFTFQGISYVIDVYRGKGKVLKNPLDVGLYISLFPQLIAGPIVRYETVAGEIKERKETVDDFSDGIARFILGLTKKVMLSNQFALIADKAYALPIGSLSVTFAWLGAIAYMLQIYFDFSGYSDMAIGLGKMFGFHFTENFNLPYIAASVSEFWRRWHISLSTWFRDYVYIPLGGNRVSKWKHARNILVVWFLTGVWHGANWTFMAWGLYFGIILMIEKFTGLGKFLERHKIFGHVYTLLLVLFSWVLFRADNIAVAWQYLGVMFGQTEAGLINDVARLYLQNNIVLYVIGILACLPFMKWFKAAYEKQNEQTKIGVQVVSIIVLAVFFFVSVSYLVKGTYNPFIYFNF